MKFISAVLVVLLHSFNAMEQTAYYALRRFMVSGICSVAVPFFFFASGVFLAVHFDEEKWWKRSVVKRVRSLLIPYVIWNVACYIATNGSAGGAEMLGFSMKMPPYNVTWFLRALFLFVLLSPLIKLMVRNTWRFVLTFAFIAGGVVLLSIGDAMYVGLHEFLLYGFSLEGFLYFMVGCLVSYREWRLPVPSWTSVGVCSLLSLLLMIAGIYCGYDLFFVLSRPLALVPLWRFCSCFSLPAILASSCMAIYLLHPAMIYALNRMAFASVIFDCASGVFVVSAAMVAASITFFAIFKAYVPLCAKLLFGFRK